MDGDDPVGRRQVEGGGAGAGALLGCQPVTGGGADQVMGVRGQRPLRVEAAAPPAGPGVSRRSAVDATAEWTSTRAR